MVFDGDDRMVIDPGRNFPNSRRPAGEPCRPDLSELLSFRLREVRIKRRTHAGYRSQSPSLVRMRQSRREPLFFFLTATPLPPFAGAADDQRRKCAYLEPSEDG
jgi:hypothetical protein